jgi:hypothetical protein
MSHWRDADIALMIFLLAIALYIPDMLKGVRTYRRGRDLARQLYRERDKPQLFDQDRDVWQ